MTRDANTLSPGKAYAPVCQIGTSSSGNFGHAGRDGEKGGSAPGNGIPDSNPLKDRYGGMPDNGGFGHSTDIEVQHNAYAEAAHCVLGSLHKAEMDAGTEDYETALRIETEHIAEEVGLMENAVEEGSRSANMRVFMEQLKDPERSKYPEASIKNIPAAGKELSRLATEQLGKVNEIKDPRARNLATASYQALKVLGEESQNLTRANAGIHNTFHSSRVIKATREVRAAADVILKGGKT